MSGTASGDWQPCPHCGMGHTGTCPRVKAIDYYENGTVKRVEYHQEYYSRPITYEVPAPQGNGDDLTKPFAT